jgi:hypothetical protein
MGAIGCRDGKTPAIVSPLVDHTFKAQALNSSLAGTLGHRKPYPIVIQAFLNHYTGTRETMDALFQAVPQMNTQNGIMAIELERCGPWQARTLDQGQTSRSRLMALRSKIRRLYVRETDLITLDLWTTSSTVVNSTLLCNVSCEYDIEYK